MLQLVKCFALLSLVTGHAHSKRHYDPPTSGKGPDKDMDCSIRALAFEYSNDLLAAYPLHAKRNSSASIYKSLGLKKCGSAHAFATINQKTEQPTAVSQINEATFFVSPAGDDANAGTKDAPFATLIRAQTEARRVEGPASVFLTPGRHELNKTMELTEADSGTTYSGTGDDVVLSGGKKLTLQWKPSNQMGGVLEAKVPAGVKFTALFVDNERQVRARFPNGNPENTFFPDGYQQDGSSWGANRQWKKKLKKTTLTT
jgi:hypothetical protein